MKRSGIITILALLFSATVYCYPWCKTSIYIDGSWLPWRDCSGVVQYGQWNNFTLAPTGDGYSHLFYIRVIIDNFVIPDRKTRKLHLKSNEWYEYSGYIEYWIDDDHPDFLSQTNRIHVSYLPSNDQYRTFDGRPRIIKRSKAIIKIEPFKKTPLVYNIWFEGIGFAFICYNKGY